MKLLVEIDTDSGETRVLKKTQLNPEEIIKVVEDYFGVNAKLDNTKKGWKSNEFTTCRQITSYLLNELCKVDTYEIADLLGYSDRSAVSAAIITVRSEIQKKNIRYTRPINYINTQLIWKQLET